MLALLEAGEESEAVALLACLELYFSSSLYPELVDSPSPPPPSGTVCLQTVAELRAYLTKHKELAIEVQRARESALVWRPLYERLLAVVAETVDEGVPFSTFPPDWSLRAQAALAALRHAFQQTFVCGYPAHFDSKLKRLQMAIEDVEHGRRVEDLGWVRDLLGKALCLSTPGGKVALATSLLADVGVTRAALYGGRGVVPLLALSMLFFSLFFHQLGRAQGYEPLAQAVARSLANFAGGFGLWMVSYTVGFGALSSWQGVWQVGAFAVFGTLGLACVILMLRGTWLYFRCFPFAREACQSPKGCLCTKS